MRTALYALALSLGIAIAFFMVMAALGNQQSAAEQVIDDQKGGWCRGHERVRRVGNRVEANPAPSSGLGRECGLDGLVSL